MSHLNSGREKDKALQLLTWMVRKKKITIKMVQKVNWHPKLSEQGNSTG